MKDTIKNSIIGAFAIFGLVALISSSNTAPTVIHEGSNIPESHVWSLTTNVEGNAYSINAETGEVRVYEHEIKSTMSSDIIIGLKEYKAKAKAFGEK